jgi:hypothetical protein
MVQEMASDVSTKRDSPQGTEAELARHLPETGRAVALRNASLCSIATIHYSPLRRAGYQ